MKIIGIETEHGISTRNPEACKRIEDTLRNSICTRAGGRLYRDNIFEFDDYHFIGQLETATPECIGARQAALYSIAEQASAAEFAGTPLFSANVSINGRGFMSSYGRHINVETSNSQWALDYKLIDGDYAPLNPMSNTMNILLSVMTLIDGSGWIDENGFRTSQRSDFVQEKSGYLVVATTALDVPTVYWKGPEGPLKDRQQTCTSDSVQSEVQQHIVPSIIEMGIDGIESGCVDLTAENKEIVRVFHELPRHYADAAKFVIQTSAGKMTAAEVHKYFIDRLPCHDTEAREKWKQIVDAIDHGDLMELWQELQFATRFMLYQRTRLRRSDTDVKFNMAFDRVSYDPSTFGMYQKLKAEGRVRRIFTDAEINAARTNPPETRAKGRAIAVHEYGMHPDFDGWDRVYFSDPHLESFADYIPLAKPSETYENEIRKTAKRIGLGNRALGN